MAPLFTNTNMRPDNLAFATSWDPDQMSQFPQVQVPTVATDQMNPMWARWLDMAGAGAPGGVDMGGSKHSPSDPFGNAQLGLANAVPQQPVAWGSLSPGFSGSSLPQSAGGPAQAPPQAPQQGEQAMNGLKNANRKQSVGAPNPYDPNFGGQIKKPQTQPTNPQPFPSGSY